MSRSITSPHRPDEIVAQVMALSATGHSSMEISRLTNVPASTIRDWLRSSELVNEHKDQAINYAEQTMHTLRSKLSRLMDERVDQALEGAKPFSDQQLAVNFGIITDKVQKTQQPQSPNDKVTIVFNVQQPPTIQEE